jgi:histidinol-phosphate aminotransferase
VVTAANKVKRAFDVATAAQEAAIASLDDAAEIERRRRLNADGLVELARTLRAHDLRVAPSVANFVFAELGGDARAFHEQLLRLGVIVRPLAGFGAPDAVRVSVGTPEENAIFAEALGQVLAAAAR